MSTLPPILSPQVSAPARERAFASVLEEHGLPGLQRARITTLQINLGKLCNQACLHCHVEAGPKRTEQMSAATADRVLFLLDQTPGIETLDITGGAPELNAQFRRMVEHASARGLRVIDRCNLTVLSEPGQDDLAEFLADHTVEVTASLPCYTAGNVDAQRGRGVFQRSLAALRQLNALGYGKGVQGRVLNLVYNPLGPSLPPAQAGLEAVYKQQLGNNHGIEFDHLFTLTNMPIKRFAEALARDGRTEEYMSLLRRSFNPHTVESLMCRSLISVGWDGQLYDCDFNQMLEMGSPAHADLWCITSFSELASGQIVTGKHCFGCTAGAGSSCEGSLRESLIY